MEERSQNAQSKEAARFDTLSECWTACKKTDDQLSSIVLAAPTSQWLPRRRFAPNRPSRLIGRMEQREALAKAKRDVVLIR